MAKNQDCFKIEKKLKDRATEYAKGKMSRSAVYRIALIEYLERNEKKQ